MASLPMDRTEDERVIALLAEYDTLRDRIKIVERKLQRECAQYGLRRGMWGFRPDHLRIRLENARD